MTKKNDEISWVPIDVRNGTDNFLKESKFWFYVVRFLYPALGGLLCFCGYLLYKIDGLYERLIDFCR